MKVRNILDISTRKGLREWYEANHATCKEFWIRVNRGKNDIKGVIPYVDSVEVALCFGWIDSTLKHIDDGYPVQRFSPRRKGGNWCERNIERCKRLVASGEMTPCGLEVIPDDVKATFWSILTPRNSGLFSTGNVSSARSRPLSSPNSTS